MGICFFNSRPHEEVDEEMDKERGWTISSTHDLTKRSTDRYSSVASDRSIFNSRPHEEVDGVSQKFDCGEKIFNSRPHEEVDFIPYIYWFCLLYLQLTTSRRGRHPDLFLSIGWEIFNSRPHEEVDCTIRIFRIWPLSSTHDLTKRSTLHSC